VRDLQLQRALEKGQDRGVELSAGEELEAWAEGAVVDEKTRTSWRITGSGSSMSSESRRRTCSRAGSVNSARIPSHICPLIGWRFNVAVA
jgi:hypothetical protein